MLISPDKPASVKHGFSKPSIVFNLAINALIPSAICFNADGIIDTAPFPAFIRSPIASAAAAGPVASKAGLKGGRGIGKNLIIFTAILNPVNIPDNVVPIFVIVLILLLTLLFVL